MKEDYNQTVIVFDLVNCSLLSNLDLFEISPCFCVYFDSGFGYINLQTITPKQER